MRATRRSRTCGRSGRIASSSPRPASSAPGRALDLACGEGQNAIWLASLGWDVVGVDYSEVAIAKARARAERDGVEAEFVCADLVGYAPDPQAFDLVLVLYLHIPADQRRRGARASGGGCRTGRDASSSSATTSRT